MTVEIIRLPLNEMRQNVLSEVRTEMAADLGPDLESIVDQFLNNLQLHLTEQAN